MPIYEYICEDCQTHFEKIVLNKTQVRPSRQAGLRAVGVAVVAGAGATEVGMNIISLVFIGLVVVVVGSAWVNLRSNWRSVQSIRTGRKAAAQEPGLDLVDSAGGLDGSQHSGHGHDCGHHGGDGGGHDTGGFHGGDHGGFDGGGGHH